MASTDSLPSDKRAQQGGLLFLASLLVFFITSIVMFLLYASWRQEDFAEFIKNEKLPNSFVTSTLCLIFISLLLHFAVRTIRREQRRECLVCMMLSLAGSILFLAIQGRAMWQIAETYVNAGLAKGLAGMVIVLALLHALHVIGGVAALVIVIGRTFRNMYDHERNWGISFAAQYWHFLDAVWLFMLAAFYFTSGGFAW